jgi:hypothetical protein
VERGLHHRFSQLFKPGTKLISVEAGSKESNKKKKKKGEKKQKEKKKNYCYYYLYGRRERSTYKKRKESATERSRCGKWRQGRIATC